MIAVAEAAQNQTVVAAISRAAAHTGADFDYLLRTATRESGLDSQAKAKTSSAAGLFQFIESTWLDMMRRHGAEAGHGDLAQAISRGPNGRLQVEDPADRSAILALRHDAETASFMAGKLTQESRERLEGALGRPASGGDLYLSHFLGAGGATEFLKAADTSPMQKAADLFPAAARANKSVFFDEAGRSKTLAQVYSHLTGEALATESAPEIYHAAPVQLASFTAPRAKPYSYAPPPASSTPVETSPVARWRSSHFVLSAGVLDVLSALEAPKQARA